MRLINTQTLELHDFGWCEDSRPPYAILSHKSGNEEVTFAEWQDLDAVSTKAGYAKIWGACDYARNQGLEWLWADTSCIDKSNSAEVSEEINSMFRYYADAEVCFAYLGDVRWTSDWSSMKSQLSKSEWFKRGWTLQELLAPDNVIFFAFDWTEIGRKEGWLIQLISEVTKIAPRHLEPTRDLTSVSVAQKMSWLARRKTQRPEDMAYCMLGIFDISMPLCYGEGEDKAFDRLQQEILTSTNDFTIFCWTWDRSVPWDWASFLAPSPYQFLKSGNFANSTFDLVDRASETPTMMMTAAGLSTDLPTLYGGGRLFMVLPVVRIHPDQDYTDDPYKLVCIRCANLSNAEYSDMSRRQHVRRIPFPPQPSTVRPGRGVNRIDPLCRQPLLLTKHSHHHHNFFDPEFELWRRLRQRGFAFFPVWRSLRTQSRCSLLGPGIGLTVRLRRWSSDVEIGVHLAPFTITTLVRRKLRQAYVFCGVKKTRQVTEVWCQLFAPKNGRLLGFRKHKATLRELEHQLATGGGFHRENYCAALDMSVEVDGDEMLSRDGTGYRCGLLQIYEGRDFAGVNEGDFQVSNLR